MATFKNYYQILELEPFADGESVKAAFRRLARLFHPDLNAGHRGAEEKFKDINEAYDVLSDPVKRARHDAQLKAKLGPERGASGKKSGKAAAPGSPAAGAGVNKSSSAKSAGPPAPEASPAGGGKGNRTASPPPMNELFESFLKKGFDAARQQAEARQQPEEGVFRAQETGSAGGGSSNRSRSGNAASSSSSREAQPRRGEDVVVRTAVTPQEATDGVVRTVNVQHNEICRRCSGTGKVNGATCTGCQGEKITVRLKKIDVKIPAGVKNGSRVRVAREGGRGAQGGEPGDLFLQIEMAYDPSLRIEGLDVYGDMPISVTEAVLGADVDVNTLSGVVTMTIPPGTQTGRVFRLKERGVQSGQTQGDHYVTVLVVVPEQLSARERELYQELARLRPDNPRPKKPR